MKAEKVTIESKTFTFEDIYCREDGTPVLKVERYDTVLSDGTTGKQFYQHHLVNGKWEYGAPPNEVPPLLDLANIRKAALTGAKVFLFEGEKKKRIACQAGLVATTAAGGANRRWEDEWSRQLFGAHVIVIPDPDLVGIQKGLTIVKNLFRYGVKATLLTLESNGPKDDFEYWLQRHSIAELAKLVANTPVWSPDMLDAKEVDVDTGIFDNTDLANAKRLVHRYGKDLIWTPEQGTFAWDNRRFEKNEAIAQQLAIQNAYLLAEEAMDEENDKRRDHLSTWAFKSQSKERIKACVTLATTHPRIYFKASDFDADPYLLNVQNGTIDLRSGQIHNHKRSDRISKLADVVYDPKATCPAFDHYFDQITDGDKEIQAYYLRCLAYAMSGLSVEETVFFLYGTGRNGKTKLLELMLSLMGDYGTTLTTETLMETKNDSNYDLADLVGARFAMANETEEGQRLREATLKKLSGGGTYKVRNPYEKFMQTRSTWSLFIDGNYKPNIKGTDEGIWDRLHVWHFKVYIPPEKRDKHLLDKMKAQKSGFLNKLLAAWGDYYGNGSRPDLKMPKEVADFGEEYRAEQDKIGEFVKDYLILHDGAFENQSVIYKAYKTWCVENGYGVRSSRRFTEDLITRFGVIKKDGDKNNKGQILRRVALAGNGFE